MNIDLIVIMNVSYINENQLALLFKIKYANNV
jgi:hypothetical protein